MTFVPAVSPTGSVPALPAPTGRFDADHTALRLYIAHTDRLLGLLPPRPARDRAQAERAAALHEARRTGRHDFLARHAPQAYEVLTDGRTVRRRLPDLVRQAQTRLPGLVPTAAQLADDHSRIQAHKEGHEVDLGVFFGALLRSSPAGNHLIDTMLHPAPGSRDRLGDFRRHDVVELDTVTVRRHGPAAHVTFRNGHCLNAEDNRLIADMETAVDLALLDERVRVGVLRGGPVDHPRYSGRRVFSAGINLKDLRNGAISYTDFLLGRELGYVNKLAHGLLTPDTGWSAPAAVHKPWVAAVDSFAIGGGMQLLLVVDRVLAAEGAFFSLPAADEGIVPGLGNLRLTRLTGARLARQVLLSGRRLRAGEAGAELVCDEVVPADRLSDAVDRAVAELAAPAVVANRAMLALAEEPRETLRSYLAEFAVVQAERIYSPDVLDRIERRWARP
ncbi:MULTISPECIES: (3,5-dihydroxyphenyl)acetyl-CoA 1,2-dioxygenase DpgC [Streptomyces]|uniref:(3,5-dihydroxyphenyl)acetyl-CoA 1,2-dioxygenase DpgC n=1 Tax=Streptomyces TaxID=1883 RepID=UPI0029B5AE77|nr:MULTISPECIES: (3,5-dihydroxyphenyl)acetyl-CoA 1,2-dioxygenase DpgC [unclassified Streptomyces]MDX3090455.1 enoyl-CoA hydratase/isomerase family protein [Streptomyces sp. ME12-02E]MDX3330442.1 enoyl-CoA hydratase/isomerase family protein [Streptomyces sp. ME02-6978a]MDX3360611.1 enoyl-CoA hydratase/isomerase family protein [Streptomyces sp. ME02-6978.2a]